MGQFSWKCAVSNEALVSKENALRESECQAYLVTPNATYFEPAYEGYGEFGGVDVYELLGNGDRNVGIDLHYDGKAPWEIKIVLAEYYNGQKYEELPRSEEDESQGWESPSAQDDEDGEGWEW